MSEIDPQAGDPASPSLPTLTWNSTTAPLETSAPVETPALSMPSLDGLVTSPAVAAPEAAPALSIPSLGTPSAQPGDDVDEPAISMPALRDLAAAADHSASIAPASAPSSTSPLSTSSAASVTGTAATFDPTPVPPPPAPATSLPTMNAMSTPVADAPAASAPAAPAPVVEAPAAPAPAPAPARVAEVPIAPAPVASVPVAEAPVAAAPVAYVPVAEVPVAEAPIAPAPAPAPAPAAQVPAAAPAAVAPTAAVAPEVASPTLGSIAPSVPVVAPVSQAAAAPAAPMALHAPNDKAQKVPSRRIANAFGAIVRTAIIAAVVAGAVFGARYGYQWYQDRGTVADSDLPAESIAAPVARSVEFSAGFGGVTTVFQVDLITGNALVQGTPTLARQNGTYYIQDALGAWSFANEAEIAANAAVIQWIDEASLYTFSDLVPVSSYGYVTVRSDESSTQLGPVFSGEPVFDMGGSEDDAASDAVVPGSIDPLESTAAASATPSANISVRTFDIAFDVGAFTAADPAAAVTAGVASSGAADIVATVDAFGVVHSYEVSGTDAVSYKLISSRVDGMDPTAELGLGAAGPAAPVETAPVEGEEQS